MALLPFPVQRHCSLLIVCLSCCFELVIIMHDLQTMVNCIFLQKRSVFNVFLEQY
mgnify:CR=1 FL=1